MIPIVIPALRGAEQPVDGCQFTRRSFPLRDTVSLSGYTAVGTFLRTFDRQLVTAHFVQCGQLLSDDAP